MWIGYVQLGVEKLEVKTPRTKCDFDGDAGRGGNHWVALQGLTVARKFMCLVGCIPSIPVSCLHFALYLLNLTGRDGIPVGREAWLKHPYGLSIDHLSESGSLQLQNMHFCSEHGCCPCALVTLHMEGCFSRR